MNQPLVSCLMPTYNRVPHQAFVLEEAIQGFLQQDYPNKELVILNDTADQYLICTSPGVRIINTSARFCELSAKLARLCSLAYGDIFCRWDDDDINLPWRISLSMRYLGDRNFWHSTRYWFYEQGKDNLVTSGGVGFNTAIFRRALLDKMGGYPLENGRIYGEDNIFLENVKRVDEYHADTLSQEEEFYIYRWDNGSTHMSGISSDQIKAYTARNQEHIWSGSYEVAPAWHLDYLARIRQAINKR